MKFYVIWAILALIGLLFLPTGILFSCGMLPTLVAYIVMNDVDVYRLSCLGSLNLAGVLPFAMRLWSGEHSLSTVAALFNDPVTWMVMYGGAAIGLMIYFAVPQLIISFYEAFYNERIGRLRKRQQILMQEWGDDVKAFVMSNSRYS